MRGLCVLVVGGLFVASLLAAPPAHACGAVVSTEQSLVLQAQQRVLISVLDDDTSRVVVELAIPSADAEFGALIPVGTQPTLDAEPVDVAEMDNLERATRPSIEIEESSDRGFGCGCGSTDESGGARGENGVNVVQVVDIGPVTAAVLAADSRAPLEQWLADNGFVVPTTEQAIIDSYVGAGSFFIAFKRSAQAPAGPSSVGVSFSAPGDMRGYPLRMSRIGAASRFAIQVFVAAPSSIAPNGSAPSTPFATLTLADFAASALANDYAKAVFDAVSARSSKAFVVEGVFRPSDAWRAGLGAGLTRLTQAGQALTRLATVVAPSTLDRDVAFLDEPPARVPRRVVAHASVLSAPGSRNPAPLSMLALLAATVATVPLRRMSRR